MMELADENGFAGQALSTQPDFSARNALSRIIRCLFAEKLLDEKKLEVFGEESRVNYRLSDGEHILQLNLTAVFPANSVINRGDIILEAADGSKTPIQSHEQLIDVLKNEFSFSPSAEGIAKFNKDVANSIHNDRLARAHRSKWRNSIAKDMEKEGESYFVKWVGRHHSLREGDPPGPVGISGRPPLLSYLEVPAWIKR